MTGAAHEVTRLLDRIRAGDDAAADQLCPIVYEQLRGMAEAVFAGRGGHTIQPTVLVHEAWLKLAGSMGRFEGRSHFYAVAAKAMRQVLTDHVKAKRRRKRGGDKQRVTLHDAADPSPGADVDLVDLNDCLERLEKLNPRHAKVVELRLLGAMTLAETADALGISPGTAHSDWHVARAWLRCELAGA